MKNVVEVPVTVPDLSPDRVTALICEIAPLHKQAWEAGLAINIWDVAGLGYNEGRNSAVLAWLLDPRGTHGWGSRVLRDLLHLAHMRHADWPNLEDSLNNISVTSECWPMGSVTDRVDIAIDGDDFVLFIEIKIRAQEGEEQLVRYVKAAEAKRQVTNKRWGLVLYLSSAAPVDPPDEVALINWQDVGDILIHTPQDGFNGAITQQFAQHIRKFY
nr:PD-(D/E)XK nuclease family protein [Acetobacter garciniae]